MQSESRKGGYNSWSDPMQLQCGNCYTKMWYCYQWQFLFIVSWKQGVVTFSGPINKLAYSSLSTLLVSRCLAVSIILISEKGDGHISWISRNNKSGIGYHQVNMGANEGTVTKIRADEESDKQCSFFVSFWPNNQSRGGGRLVTAFQSERLVFKFTGEQVEVLIKWVCQTSTSVKIVIKD